MLEEDLQTSTVEPGQVEAEALTRCGFNGRVEPQPLVLVLYNPRGTKAERTPTSTVPALEPEARFVKGENPQLALASGFGIT